VALVVSSDVSLFEMSAAYDIFGVDPQLGIPWYRCGVYSGEAAPVRTSMPGITVDDVRPIDSLDVGPGDVVIVMPPSRASRETLDGLRRVRGSGARLASLCTGAFVLAEAGILDGRRATTHWSHAATLTECYPAVDVDPRVLYVDEGDLLTSAGSAAGIDLCLHIVRCDYGAEVANLIARDLVVAPHREGGQAQFITAAVRDVPVGDPFAATLQWVQANLDGPITIDDLAARSAMSPRTFARRFRETTGTTPLQWLLSQRLRLAQRLLETSDLPIDRIAEECGLGSPANLRFHFQQNIGTTPTGYRRTFRAQAS
jgi:AraC family transcriptional regulator, transcriptional activator FtrA